MVGRGAAQTFEIHEGDIVEFVYLTERIYGFVRGWKNGVRGMVLQVHQGNKNDYSKYEVSMMSEESVAPGASTAVRAPMPALM